MAGVIDKLVYKVGYETDEASLSKAQQGFKSLVTLAVRLTAAATAVGTALFAMAKSAASYGDSVAKTADKLGIGIEALQELRHAADLAGISQASFDMSIQRSTRRISEAATGSGTAAKALDELGLSAKALNDLAPEDQINILADAFQNITSDSDRMRIAFDIFGREGMDMVNMLRRGSEGINEYRKELNDLGAVLDEDSIRQAEEFTDQMSRLGKVFTGIKNSLGAALFKPIIDIAEQFLVWYKINQAMIQQNLTAFINGVATALGIMWRALTLITSPLRALVELMGGWEKAMRFIITGIALLAFVKFAVVVKTLITLFVPLTAAMGAFTLAAAKPLLIAAAIAVLIIAVEDLITWLRGGESALESWLGPIDRIRLAFTDMFDLLFRNLDRLSNLGGGVLDFLKGLTGKDSVVINRQESTDSISRGLSNTRNLPPNATIHQNVDINIQGSGDPLAIGAGVRSMLEQQQNSAYLSAVPGAE